MQYNANTRRFSALLQSLQLQSYSTISSFKKHKLYQDTTGIFFDFAMPKHVSYGISPRHSEIVTHRFNLECAPEMGVHSSESPEPRLHVEATTDKTLSCLSRRAFTCLKKGRGHTHIHRVPPRPSLDGQPVSFNAKNPKVPSRGDRPPKKKKKMRRKRQIEEDFAV